MRQPTSASLLCVGAVSGTEAWLTSMHQSMHLMLWKMIDEADMFPSEARVAFHNTVDWLENKACARRSGLGTPLPFDKDWIVGFVDGNGHFGFCKTTGKYINYSFYYIVSQDKRSVSVSYALKISTNNIFFIDCLMLCLH